MQALVTNRTRIAVVGSSGNLLYRRHGAEIDAHDVIVRVNSAGVAGYEEDVGSHTEIRVGWFVGLSDAMERQTISRGEVLVLTTPNKNQGSANWRTFRNGRCVTRARVLRSTSGTTSCIARTPECRS